MSSTQTVREPLVRIVKREGATLPKKILVRAVAILRKGEYVATLPPQTPPRASSPK